jgi:ParB family chromosome partitioning protein
MAQISLKALAEDKSVEGVSKTTYFKVNPLLLHEEEGFNLRDYDDPEVIEYINGFADAYESGDYVPPLAVRTDEDGRIIVVEGHCRRRGALIAIERGAALNSVDAVPFKGNDVERTELMLRSGDSLKLKPLGVALGYLRLSRMGHSNSVIAKRMRKTSSHVEQMLLLATANHDVHKLVREGGVSATAAIEAVREYGERAGEFLQGKLSEAVGRGKKSVTRGAVKGWMPPRKVVSSVIGTVESVVSKLDNATRVRLAELENAEPARLEGQKIEVDAASFLELVKAHGAVADAKASKDQADAAAKQSASQQSLEIQGEGESGDENGN